MKKTLIAILVVILLNTIVIAQGMHSNEHKHTEKLGRVNFSISCTPKAQREFNLAVAWLHSFEYEPAAKAFSQVAATDPRCGMAYWGVAMSFYHPLWASPSPTELENAWNSVEKAKTVGAKTKRELDYIAAIESFYKDYDKRDHRTRVLAYCDAMDQLYKTYPADREAAVFYALALIAKGTMANDKRYLDEKMAARILNRVLRVEPRHPGVAHYLIHSYDYPALAHLALPAARSYAKIAPSSAHARHMPSHIFTRLGYWQEAIQSNLNARAAAVDYAVKNHMPGAWDEQLHAMDYLAYAYLQGAQDNHALRVLNDLNKIRRVDPPNFKVAYSFSAIPARYALERRQWSEAAKLPVPPGHLEAFPWDRFLWAEAQVRFARAIGAARSSDATLARQEIEKLADLKQRLTTVRGDYDWAKQVDIAYQIASAWLMHVEGRPDDAVRLMRAAADLDDSTDKHPVTPGSLLPAREQLGELLLELKQPAAALTEFESSLLSTPNRFNAVYGAARAAKLADDRKKAKTYYTQLITLSRHADSPRPELSEAKKFLGDMESRIAITRSK